MLWDPPRIIGPESQGPLGEIHASPACTEELSMAGQGTKAPVVLSQQGLRALPCAGSPDQGVALTVAMPCVPPVQWGVGAGGTGCGLGSFPPAGRSWIQCHFLPGSSAWTGTEASCARPNQAELS